MEKLQSNVRGLCVCSNLPQPWPSTLWVLNDDQRRNRLCYKPRCTSPGSSCSGAVAKSRTVLLWSQNHVEQFFCGSSSLLLLAEAPWTIKTVPTSTINEWSCPHNSCQNQIQTHTVWSKVSNEGLWHQQPSLLTYFSYKLRYCSNAFHPWPQWQQSMTPGYVKLVTQGIPIEIWQVRNNNSDSDIEGLLNISTQQTAGKNSKILSPWDTMV